MKFYIPPQLTRLTLALAIFVSLFLILRYFLVPPTFGQFGHYRGDSLRDNADLGIHYAGEQACLECHQDVEDLKAQDVHAGIHCEICHGPGQKHVLSNEATDILKPSGRDFCGTCHQKNAARPASAIVQIEQDSHNPDNICTECHNPHQPWATLK
jgi:hypothetical protein